MLWSREWSTEKGSVPADRLTHIMPKPLPSWGPGIFGPEDRYGRFFLLAPNLFEQGAVAGNS